MSRNHNQILRKVLCLVMALLLIPALSRINTYAYADNTAVMSGFPAPGAEGSDAEMQNNNGTIATLYSGGHVTNNNGTIKTCDGDVSVNNGTIETASKKIGTNYGTIGTLTGYSVLNTNAKEGTVTTNLSTIEYNYGTITENHSKVNMFGGTIETNGAAGTVTLTGGGVNGTIKNNAGTVTIKDTSEQIIVESNTGSITISSGRVTVTDNSGTITLESGASLTCTNNSGTITKTDDAENYLADCTNNYGTVDILTNPGGSYPVTNNYLPVAVDGDDGNASIVECASVYEDKNYTTNSAELTLSIPDGYGCTNKNAVQDTEDPTKWKLTTYINGGDTQYTVNVHQCPASDLQSDDEYHWQVCATCGAIQKKAAHTYGEYTSNDDATCITDGTKTRTCSECDHQETVTDTDSHLSSTKHNPVTDPRVEPTETSTGLTEGSHCADCSAVLTAQTVIPKKENKGGGTTGGNTSGSGTIITPPRIISGGGTTGKGSTSSGGTVIIRRNTSSGGSTTARSNTSSGNSASVRSNTSSGSTAVIRRNTSSNGTAVIRRNTDSGTTAPTGSNTPIRITASDGNTASRNNTNSFRRSDDSTAVIHPNDENGLADDNNEETEDAEYNGSILGSAYPTGIAAEADDAGTPDYSGITTYGAIELEDPDIPSEQEKKHHNFPSALEIILGAVAITCIAIFAVDLHRRRQLNRIFASRI